MASPASPGGARITGGIIFPLDPNDSIPPPTRIGDNIVDDGNISIQPVLKAPDVIFPKSGDKLEIGKEVNITWTPPEIVTSVQLAITGEQKDNVITSIVSGIPNEGFYIWTPNATISAKVTENSRYFILVAVDKASDKSYSGEITFSIPDENEDPPPQPPTTRATNTASDPEETLPHSSSTLPSHPTASGIQPPSEGTTKDKGLPKATIAGIGAGAGCLAVVVLVLLLILLNHRIKSRRKGTEGHGFDGNGGKGKESLWLMSFLRKREEPGLHEKKSVIEAPEGLDDTHELDSKAIPGRKSPISNTVDLTPGRVADAELEGDASYSISHPVVRASALPSYHYYSDPKPTRSESPDTPFQHSQTISQGGYITVTQPGNLSRRVHELGALKDGPTSHYTAHERRHRGSESAPGAEERPTAPPLTPTTNIGSPVPTSQADDDPTNIESLRKEKEKLKARKRYMEELLEIERREEELEREIAKREEGRKRASANRDGGI